MYSNIQKQGCNHEGVFFFLAQNLSLNEIKQELRALKT